MDNAFEAVKEVIEHKRAEKRRPLIALPYEIGAAYAGEDLEAELEALVEVKILVKGRTINHDYYAINGQEID